MVCGEGQVRSAYEDIMWGGCWAVTKEEIENAGEDYRALADTGMNDLKGEISVRY